MDGKCVALQPEIQIEEVMLRKEGEIFICYGSIYISWIVSVPGVLSVAHMFVLGSWKKTND